jgi:hypothetical protein
MIPIREIVLYKHGVGFFVRYGTVEGTTFTLTFRTSHINDVLKSLTVFEEGRDSVLAIQFDGHVNREQFLGESDMSLSPHNTLQDLLRDLRGQQVTVSYHENDKLKSLVGRIVGLETDTKAHDKVLIQASDQQIRVLNVEDLRGFRLLDEAANTALALLLDHSRTSAHLTRVTAQLAEGQHELTAYYVAPSPPWRVSYRIVAETHKDGQTGQLLLQGWGIFDNTLDEDLNEVKLRLVAGQPVSFIYDLYAADVPDRPFISDRARPAAPPVVYSGAEVFADALEEDSGDAAAAPRLRALTNYAMASPKLASRMEGLPRDRMARAAAQEVATQRDLGELFEYRVLHPVTIRRGASALVPILSASVSYERELLFNPQKQDTCPVSALRFVNSSGLVLERGPVTVIENSAYVGEALLAFTPRDSTVYLPFANDLSIRIRTENEMERVFAGLQLAQGDNRAPDYVREQHYLITRRRFYIMNNSDTPRTITLELARPASGEWYETPPAASETLDETRWRVEAPARRLTQVVFKSRQMVEDRVQMRQLTMDVLRRYLQEKYLDDKTFASLQEIVQLYEALDTLDQRAGALKEQEDDYHKRAEEWRKTLGVLREGSDDYRQELVNNLRRTDEAVSELREQARSLERQKTAGKKKLNAALKALASQS